LKFAVTLLLWVSVTVQLLVPVHAPLQPANAERFAGVAFNVTTVPPLKAALHVLPQLMPVGLELTVPEPVPVVLTVSATVCRVNAAVTLWAWLMLTVHDPAPVQAPLQPVKVEPASGIASRVTLVPLAKLALQAVPQFMPAGLEATIPVPVPFFVTPSVYVLESVVVNVAVTFCAADIVTAQLFVPVQAPLQPANVEPAAGAAVRVTLVPELKLALHAAPQLMPVGDEVTVPLPVPALPTVRA
jgi:hypothetical protein